MNGKGKEAATEMIPRKKVTLKKTHRHLGVDESAGAEIHVTVKQEKRLKEEEKI
jgi:hypothetical protein